MTEERSTWGRWVYHPDPFVLRLAENTRDEYEVDLDRCTSSAEMLDWIMQVASKPGVTAEDLGHLVGALNHLFHPQAYLCSGGEDKRIDPRATVEQAQRDHEEGIAWEREMRQKGNLLGPRIDTTRPMVRGSVLRQPRRSPRRHNTAVEWRGQSFGPGNDLNGGDIASSCYYGVDAGMPEPYINDARR
jgi:hypothetical protein